MNKQEIINNIAKDFDLSKIQARAIFEQIFKDITEALTSSKTDNKIQIPDFGTFKMEKRSERMGRNPKTGESMKIPAKQVVKFKISKSLEDRIN